MGIERFRDESGALSVRGFERKRQLLDRFVALLSRRTHSTTSIVSGLG
jgi:hypothetical protein